VILEYWILDELWALFELDPAEEFDELLLDALLELELDSWVKMTPDNAVPAGHLP